MEQDLNSKIIGKEQQTTTKQVIVKYAIIYALALIVLALVSYILELSQNNLVLTIVSMTSSFGILFFGIKTRKNEIEGGLLTYGQGVTTGIGIVAFGALIFTLYTVVFNTYIDPDFIKNVLQQAKVEMLEKGMSDEQIDAAMKVSENFMNPLFNAFTTYFGSLFLGTLFSLVVAIFTKNNKSIAEVNA